MSSMYILLAASERRGDAAVAAAGDAGSAPTTGPVLAGAAVVARAGAGVDAAAGVPGTIDRATRGAAAASTR